MADETNIIELTKELKSAKQALRAQRRAERAQKRAQAQADKTNEKTAEFATLRAAFEQSLVNNPDGIIRADMKELERWVRAMKIPYQPRSHSFTYLHRDRPPGFIGRVAARALSGTDFASGNPELIAYLYADVLRQEYVNRLRAALPLGANAPDGCLKFLTFFLQREPTALEVAVFSQFIWQIKRKIHGLPTEWEIMPLFIGGQGWGKTRHLQRLFAAIPELTAFIARGQRLTIFNDPFGRALFAQCYVVPFEEMAGAKAVDIETLKSFITEPDVQARIMRAEQFTTMPNNATFYGTSNMPAGASLSDSTGYRRFCPIECPNIRFDVSKHLQALEGLDMRAVWASVDASTDASPVRPFLEELNEFQEKTFSRFGAFHDFFTECVRDCWAEEPTKELTRPMLWDAFQNWLQGQSAYKYEKLKKQQIDDYFLKNYSIDRVKNRPAGRVFLGFSIKE